MGGASMDDAVDGPGQECLGFVVQLREGISQVAEVALVGFLPFADVVAIGEALVVALEVCKGSEITRAEIQLLRELFLVLVNGGLNHGGWTRHQPKAPGEGACWAVLLLQSQELLKQLDVALEITGKSPVQGILGDWGLALFSGYCRVFRKKVVTLDA